MQCNYPNQVTKNNIKSFSILQKDLWLCWFGRSELLWDIKNLHSENDCIVSPGWKVWSTLVPSREFWSRRGSKADDSKCTVQLKEVSSSKWAENWQSVRTSLHYVAYFLDFFRSIIVLFSMKALIRSCLVRFFCFRSIGLFFWIWLRK